MVPNIKKLLINVLIVAIVLLPFRMAFSMPIDNSGEGFGQHCKGMAMADTSSSGLTQLLETQLPGIPSNQQSPDVDAKAVVKPDCCSSGGSDCSGCAHISAIYFDFLQFSDVSGDDVFSETPLSFITRILSPPSRPPLVVHI